MSIQEKIAEILLVLFIALFIILIYAASTRLAYGQTCSTSGNRTFCGYDDGSTTTCIESNGRVVCSERDND